MVLRGLMVLRCCAPVFCPNQSNAQSVIRIPHGALPLYQAILMCAFVGGARRWWRCGSAVLRWVSGGGFLSLAFREHGLTAAKV